MSPARTRKGRRLALECLEDRQMLSVSEPNNSFAQAVVVPDIYLETQYFAQDVVSTASDTDDYFKFYNLYGPSKLYVALYGLSTDADLYVYNGSEQLMLSSTAGGNLSENIQLDLPGNDYYYVRVRAFSGTTNYNLLVLNDYAGATGSTARDVGTAWGQTNSDFYPYNEIFYREYMDFRDNVDMVKFHMEAPGTISVRRQPINSPSTVVTTTQLLDSSLSLLATASEGNGGQNIDRYPVPAGDYYLKVTHVDGAGDYQFRITADYAGETTATARDLGDLTGSSRRMFDMVGGPFLPSYEDSVDYYRFTFDEPAPLDVRLTIPPLYTQPTFDASLRLARDSNGNGFISPDEVLASSANSGMDSISTFLNAGTYYVLVDQNGAYTNYELDLDSDFDAVPFEPAPDKNLSQARTAGPLIGEISFDDGTGISAGDYRDFFQFGMETAGKFTASISINPFWSRYHLDPFMFVVKDANFNHLFDAGEEVTPYAFGGTLEAELPAGNYFLAVSVPGEQAAYSVRMVPDYAGSTLGTARPFASVDGSGGEQVFRDYIEQDFGPGSDVDDFYRFTLASSNQVTLTTSGVNGEDLSLMLIRDANSNGVVDAGEVLQTSNLIDSPVESISAMLAAGEYFVQVTGINGATNYELTLDTLTGAGQADFNGDGHVNAADYVHWRNRGGSPAQFALWKAHFGQSVAPAAGSGQSAKALVASGPVVSADSTPATAQPVRFQSAPITLSPMAIDHALADTQVAPVRGVRPLVREAIRSVERGEEQLLLLNTQRRAAFNTSQIARPQTASAFDLALEEMPNEAWQAATVGPIW